MRNYTLAKILLIVSFFFVVWDARGQVQSNAQLAKVIPPSPNAAALMKFADVPVSPYTGVPNIDIPLVTAKSGELTVPVSLSYHAGGIKINEEASWVGLGWNLNAGGAISRSIMDKDDFGGGYFVNNLVDITTQPTRMLFQESKIQFPGNQYFPNGLYDISQAISESGFFDFEADLFTYNFLGRSGKFIISRKKKVVLSKHEDLKIIFDPGGESFVILDEQGTSYLFDFQERSTSNETLLQPVTSWYLTEIKSHKGDEIKLIYEKDVSPTYMLSSIIETSNYNCVSSPSPIQVSTTHFGVHLKQIEFDNGLIEFYADNERADLQGGKKLNSVKVFALNPREDKKLIKDYEFRYSYINEEMQVNNDQEYLRLKLDKVIEKASGIQLPGYEFAYNFPSPYYAALAGKKSFSIDHWGYFNGVDNKTFIPRYRGLYRNFLTTGYTQTWVDLPGADRYTRPEHVGVYSLKEIKYPTGGKSKFEFEAHDYDELNSINIDFSQGYPEIEETDLIEKTEVVSVTSRGLAEGTVDLSRISGNLVKMTIAFRCSDFDGCTRVKSGLPYEAIYFEANGIRRDITNNELTCGSGSPVCSSEEIDVRLYNGRDFKWKSYISPNVGSAFQEIRVVLKWVETRKAQRYASANNRYSYAGGLRVKRITDFDQNNRVVKKREYNYHFEEDANKDGIKEIYSYGRRMAPPSYYRYETVFLGPNIESCRACKTFTRTGASNTALSNSAQGSIVGYDKVTETFTDSTGTVFNGKTEYNYHNNSDKLFNYSEQFKDGPMGLYSNVFSLRVPGLLNLSDNKNGLLKEKLDYAFVDRQLILRQRQRNYYRNFHDTVYYNIKYAETYNPNCADGAKQPKNFIYPVLKSESIVMDSVETILFDPDDPLKSIKTVQRNFYDSPLHKQLTKSSVNTSDGQMIITDYKYPLDVITGLSASARKAKDILVSRHIIAPVLEQTVYRGNLFISRTRNNYKVFNNNLVLPDNIEFQQGRGSLEKRVEFQQYDERGNLVQQAKTNDVSTIYLWGYDKKEPVAQIVNAIYHRYDDFIEESYQASAFFNSSVNEIPLPPAFTLNYRQSIQFTINVKAFGEADANLKLYLKDSRNNIFLSRDYGVGTYTDTLTLPTGNYTFFYLGRVFNTTGESGARLDIQVDFKVHKSYPNIFYTSFEEEQTHISTESRTGRKCYHGPYALAMPRKRGKYILSFWEMVLSGTWQYKEEEIIIDSESAADKVIGSDSSFLDEVRLYPVDAQMTTYTYDPLIGLTSVTDPNNLTTYYDYDLLGRLKAVKDDHKNILKRYEYRYMNY